MIIGGAGMNTEFLAANSFLYPLHQCSLPIRCLTKAVRQPKLFVHLDFIKL